MRRRQRRGRRLTRSALVFLSCVGLVWVVAWAWPALIALPPLLVTLLRLAVVVVGLVAAGSLYWMLYGTCPNDCLSLLQAVGLVLGFPVLAKAMGKAGVPRELVEPWWGAAWGFCLFGCLRVAWHLMPLTHDFNGGYHDPDAGPEDDDGPAEDAKPSSLSRAPQPDSASARALSPADGSVTGA